MADEKLQEQEQQYRRLLAQQQRNWGIQPDAAAQQRNTARQLGVPAQAVQDAPEYAAQRAAFEKVWRETEGLGTLRSKMGESEFHALAKDDVAQLGTVEKHARAFADGAVEGSGSMMEGFGEMLGAGWRSFVRGASRLLLPEKEGVDLSKTHMGAIGQGDFGAGWKVAGGNVKQVSNQYIDIPEAQKTYSTQVAGGLGQLLPQAASHLMFGGAGTVLTGAAMGADQMADEVRNDNAPQLNKDLAVLGSAAFTGLSDKLVFDRLSGAFKPAAGQTLSDAVKRIGIGTASEALQEASESVVNDMLRQNLTKPEHEISLKQALESGSVGGGVGFVATALFESAAGIRLRHQQRAAERAQADGEHLQQQSENMAQSNLARRAPDVAADYVNEVYGQNAKVYVDADALMQSGVAERVVEKMPQLAPKLAEAAATGGMVEISRGDLHTVLNEPEIQSALLPHVRTSPDAMTAAEAKQFAESGEAEAMAEALNEAVAGQQEAAAKRESLAAVDAAIRSQLMETGRFTPEQAGINAALAASQYQATAARLGMTADELYRQRPLHIVGEPLQGGLAQALAANPPRGWVHAEDGQAAADLWNGNSAAQAVFWTEPNTKLEKDFPELAGYSHSVSSFALNHIRKRHGDAKAEAARGQLHITEADIARIDALVRDYDSIAGGLKAQNGNQRLMFAKVFEDGTVVYMADVSRKKRDLQSVSMWKYPVGLSAEAAIERAITQEGKERAYSTTIDEKHDATANQTSETGADIALSAWKYPPTADVAKVLEHVSRPSLYVRNGEAAYDNDTAADSENQLLFQGLDTPESFGALAEQAAPVRQAASFAEARSAVAGLIGQELTNRETGMVATVSGKTLNKMLSGKAHGKSANLQAHLSAVANVDKLFENAVLGWTVQDKNSDTNIEGVHRMFAPLLVGGEMQLVKLTVKEFANNQGNRIYSLETLEIEHDNSPVPEMTDADSKIGLTSHRLHGADVESLIQNIQNFNRHSGSLNQNARGMFDPASDTIALLQRADASTFAHELGHFFLEMHTDLAVQLADKPERTAAENSLVRDVQTLMDWFGVENVAAWRAMTLAEQRAYHEQFARGFEAYLYEGKAPSSALREVFRRFATWLKHVYRSLAELNVALTDDVRAVYGRMLATEEAIEQTQYESGMLPLFASAEDMGVSEETFAEYRQAAAQAEAEAQEELQGKALRDLAFVRNLRSQYIRNMKKQHKADFEKAEMDARRSIMRQPVYRAWQLLAARMDAENRIDDSKEQRELRHKAKVLQGAPVFEVKQRTAPNDNKALREWATGLFDSIGNKATNPEIGEVALTARSVKDSMAHGMNADKAMAFEAVPTVIEKGVVVAQAEHGEMTSYYISAPVMIEGKADIVTALVRQDVNTSRLYLHSVTTKEKLLGEAPNESVADTEVSQPHGKLHPRDIANILRRYLTVKTDKPKALLDNTADSLFAAIAKLGGLNREELAAQWGLDAKDKPGNPVFGMPVLRRSKGKSLDAMVEALAEEGYLPVDNTGKADVRDLEERFFDELRGTPLYSRFYVPQEPAKAGSEVANLFALTAVRFDHDSLLEMGVGEDMLAVLKARGMVRKNGGLHPDFVAEMVRDENGLPEFASGEALLRSVFEAEPPQEAIEQTAYLNVLAAKGEVPTQADFEAAADAAVHSRLRARVLAAEFKALAKATGSVNLLRRAAANHARDKVADIRLADLRPAQYTRAEARAARQAQQAMARAEIQEAAAYKRNQLVQNALAREALSAKEEAAKARRDLSALARRTLKKTAKSYDADLMSAAQAVAGMFGIAPKKGERAAAYLENLKQYDPQSYDLAAGVVQRAEDLAYRTDGRFDNLTVAQMRALRDDVMALRHTAKRMREVEIDGKRMSTEAAQADLLRQIDALPQRLAGMGADSAPTKAERGVMKFYETAAALRRVENWAQSMDGLKGFAFQRYVFQPIKDASDRYRAEKAGYLKRYRDIIEGVEFKRGKIEAPELGYVFGEESGGTGMNEVLHAILHTGNASNKRKLLLGRKWAHLNEDGSLDTGRWDAFVARLIAEGKLTKQHFDAAQQIWDLMEEMKPKAQAAHREMLGYYFDEITAEPLMTPFGEYRGGYVPALKDARIVPDAKGHDALKLEQEAMQHAFPATGRGFTKNRTESNDPLLLNMNSLSGHIDQVLRFSHLQVPLRDVNRLLNGIRKELETVAPGARKYMLDPWLKRVATQKLTTPDQADGFFGRMAMTLRNRAGMAAMIGNIPNAVQQLAGFPLASVRVQSKYLARATADFMAHPKQVAAAVAAASPYMDARLGNQIGIMTEHIERILVNPTRWERFNNWTAGHAYFAQEWVDSMMAPIIWQAAYNQSVAEGANHRDAVRFADSVIRQTQGSVLVEDVSKVETGSPGWRLATQFYGYFNMLGNLLVTETLNAKRDLRGGERTKRLLYIWGVAYYATAVTAELLMGVMRGGYEDEDRDGEVIDDWIKQVFLLSPAKTLLSTLPFAGALANFADDKSYNDRAFSPPALSMLERSLKAATGKSNFDKQSGIRDAGTALAMLFGIPAAPLIAKPLGYWRGVETGEIRPTGAIDAVRGSITGVASPASK